MKRVHSGKKKISFDAASYSQMLTSRCTHQEPIESEKCFAVALSIYLSRFLLLLLTLWALRAQLRACSFLIIQKRTVWNTSSLGRKMQGETRAEWLYEQHETKQLRFKSCNFTLFFFFSFYLVFFCK